MADSNISNIRQSNREGKKLQTWHVVVTLVVVVMVAIVAATSFFVWNRWYRFNDAEDIQGQWYVMGTDVPIQITPEVLDFNVDTSYRYSIDTDNKVITFNLGNMDGQAHYCFLEDRQVLVIIDGRNFDRWDTAGQDLLSTLKSFSDLSSGRIPRYPEDEGIIVLCREPDKYSWGDFSYKIVEEPTKKPEVKPKKPANPNEGKHRADDPFDVVSDILEERALNAQDI